MLYPLEGILKNSRHPEDSLQLRGQAETPQCWCGRQNMPSVARFDGPEATEMMLKTKLAHLAQTQLGVFTWSVLQARDLSDRIDCFNLSNCPV